jgi:UDP-N-acetylglucosamine 2-epimerase (non-hydrolysing)
VLKKKILLAFGTRPEAIKMAPLIHALKKYPDEFLTLVCVSAQHRQMLDQVLNTFEIRPDIDLNLMLPGQDLFDITASVLLEMRSIFKEHKPDLILVHGDTTTTLAVAMAAFYSGISVGHVEAGLRTYDLKAPFPEEFNRQLTSRVARWHFAPTNLSQKNLLSENYLQDSISITGNTVIDALFWVLDRIESTPQKKRNIREFLNSQLPFNWLDKKFILITGHRRENFGKGFLQICNALKELALRFPDVHFIYPVHPNPNVQGPVNLMLSDFSNVHLIAPLEYEPFVYLLKHCYLVLTDSGGIQEEAPSLGKPVLVMRDVTERPEAVEAGTVKLVGANEARIVIAVSELLSNEASYLSMASSHNPYGDGKACERIIKFIRTIYDN